MTARDHNKILSILFFAQAGLQLFGGIIAIFIYGGIGTFMITSGRREEEQAMGGFLILIAIVVAVFFILFVGFYLFTAWKLLKEKSVGRILGIIASFLSLLNVPFGTALGIYGLWFLMGEQGTNFYSEKTLTSSNPVPPQPSGWQ